MLELELEGHAYRLHKINALKQFHIVRRLAPALGELAPALKRSKPDDESDGLDALPALAAALAKLSDDDADHCLFGLLAAVSRKQPNGTGWAPVSANGQLMYDDIDMPTMLKLAWQVAEYNLSGFLPALRSASAAAPLRPKGQSLG